MEKVAILGCGTMGHSIALSAAWANYEVIVFGLNEQDIENAQISLQSKLTTLLEQEAITQQIASLIQANIRFSTSLQEVVQDKTFIIEAIPENLALKQQTFTQLEELISATTIIASNTSGIMPSLLAEKMQYPNRLVITHFWNPAHLVPLVEIVKGDQTDDATIDRTMALMHQFHKKPIKIEKEIAGFVGNRLQFALFREAQYLYELGIASKEDIDAAVVYSIGRRLSVTGPLLSADLTGLDVVQDITSYLFEDLSATKQVGPSVATLTEQNHLGYKTGQGYYEWTDALSTTVNKEREQTLINHLKQDLEKTLR